MRGSGYEDHFLFLFGGVAFFRGGFTNDKDYPGMIQYPRGFS
jgi:hypothetical protein